ncbi:hypothetical protein PFISCL1PPCAC_6262, partial [Pristionchus fissidentatus]
VHTFKILQSLGGREGSVRIDALYPLVFEGDEIGFLIGRKELMTWPEGIKNFALHVTPHFRDELSPPSLAEICSTRLRLDSTVIGVSSEALGAASPFFCALLYGNFNEKNQQIVDIKEVCRPFLQCFLNRRWTVNTVSTAISYFQLADRLMMLNACRRLFDYIMLQPQHILQQYLSELVQFAARVSNNKGIVVSIIRLLPTTLQCHDMLLEIMFSLSPATLKAAYA